MKNQFIICTLQEKFTTFPSKLGPNAMNKKITTHISANQI